jgi:hypothetical protein
MLSLLNNINLNCFQEELPRITGGQLYRLSPYGGDSFFLWPKGSRKNKFTFLSADASCQAALRKLKKT